MTKSNETFSQNFLINPQFVSQLINLTDLESDDLVLEIGPGTGSITRELLKRVTAGKIIGIEKDPKFYPKLEQLSQTNPVFELEQGDFLKYRLPKGKYKIVSNLPFSITSAVVNRLLVREPNSPEEIYFILEYEAFERFAGRDGEFNTQYSLLLAPFFELEILTDIAPFQFSPQPRANIVFCSFKKLAKPRVEMKYKSLYGAFIVDLFSNFRTNMHKSLGQLFTENQIKRIDKDLGIRKFMKPSDLTKKQIITLFNLLVTIVDTSKHRELERRARRTVGQSESLQQTFGRRS